MIPHVYIKASEDPGAYEADLIDRQAVSVQFAWDHLCDEPLYLFSEPRASAGMDPWIMVTGLDRSIGTGDFVIEFGRSGERGVAQCAAVLPAQQPAQTGVAGR